jgi:hypothetical protein
VALTIVPVSLRDIAASAHLRLGADYHTYVRQGLPSTFLSPKTSFRPFGSLLAHIRNGENVDRASYSPTETDYLYLTVNNVAPNELSLRNAIHLDDIAAGMLAPSKLKQGDIILTRTGGGSGESLDRTPGLAALFPDTPELTAIPSGYLIVLNVDQSQADDRFVSYYLNSPPVRRFFDVMAVGKRQKNLSQESVKALPFPSISKMEQRRIADQIDTEIWSCIRPLVSSLRPLDDLIDEVLIRYDLKAPTDTDSQQRFFPTTLAAIAGNNVLRCGPLYRAFWDLRGGHLFTKGPASCPTVPLQELASLAQTGIAKKGTLPEEAILIELDDIEQGTGRILTYRDPVSEIESDKVLFAHSDLLTSKLRPYLRYTVLNDPALPLIGSTELVPISVKKDRALPQYLQYLLLSKDYAQAVTMLMYGKEHPRIDMNDLLHVIVPNPPIPLQQAIVDELEVARQEQFRCLDEICRLRLQVVQRVWTELS